MKFLRNYIDKMQTNAYEGENFELIDETCESEKELSSGFTTSTTVKTYERVLEDNVRNL